MIKDVWCWISGFWCMHVVAPQIKEKRNHKHRHIYAFFGLIGIDVYYLKHKLQSLVKKNLIQRDDTGSTCNCTAKGPAVSATLTHHYKSVFFF